jgi:GNAT superfamily N-acetyltransferase
MDELTVDNELRAGDIGEMVALHGRLYRQEYGYDHRFEAYVAAGIADALLAEAVPPPRFWLVRHGGELAGSAAVCTKSCGVAQFRWFLLAPVARSKGLGRSLLAECLAHCRASGYRKALLWTVDGLAAAKTLYLAEGFTETRRCPATDPWGVPVTEVRYDLALA